MKVLLVLVKADSGGWQAKSSLLDLNTAEAGHCLRFNGLFPCRKQKDRKERKHWCWH